MGKDAKRGGRARGQGRGILSAYRVAARAVERIPAPVALVGMLSQHSEGGRSAGGAPATSWS